MDHDPQTYRKSQSKPDQIAGGLVERRKGFALGAAHAHDHDHERPDKQRTKSDGQYSQPHRDGRCPDVRRTELLRFGAHGLNLAPITILPFRLEPQLPSVIVLNLLKAMLDPKLRDNQTLHDLHLRQHSPGAVVEVGQVPERASEFEWTGR